MVAKRIIPCLDMAAGRVVKGVNFVGLRDAGDPVELACRYDAAGADELVFLDIAASHQGRGTLVELVQRTAEQLFIPFTVGGGISSVEGITELLRAGADKVSLNSAAVADPELIRAGARQFGAQCIVVAIDGRKRMGGGWDVYVKGGAKILASIYWPGQKKRWPWGLESCCSLLWMATAPNRATTWNSQQRWPRLCLCRLLPQGGRLFGRY